MKVNYNKKDIERCFNNLNIKKNDILYITGNLSNFGRINIKKLRYLPSLFFKNIMKKIGPGGTIVVPTHSFYLTKTNKIFDIKKTPCETGAFSNYVLNKKNIIRQCHPYSSSSAIGKKAKFICSKNTCHVYGPDSPFERMIKLNAKFISLGMNINENCSQVHQAEYDMSVPYRYTKEFTHKIKIRNKTFKKKFYMFVLYKKYTKIKRNKNFKIIKNFLNKQKVNKQKLGLNYVYSYNLKKFYDENILLLKKDIFCWLGMRPKKFKN